MREIIFKRAEMHELSENAWDSREMRETWQVCALCYIFITRGYYNYLALRFTLQFFKTILILILWSISCTLNNLILQTIF